MMHLNRFTCFLLFSVLWYSSLASGAGLIPSASAEVETSSVIVVPEKLSPDDVGEFVAPLGEEQVRSLLIDTLRADALAGQEVVRDTPGSMLDLLKGIGNPNSRLGGALIELQKSGSTYGSSVGSIVNGIADGEGYQGFIKIVMLLVLLVLGAWLIESASMRKWYKKEFAASEADQPDAWKSRFKYPFYYLLVHAIGLIIFAVAGHVIANSVFDNSTNSFKALTRFFDLAITFRFLVVGFKFLMYSPPRGLDLIDDRIDKPMLEKCFIAFIVIYYVAFHGFIVTLAQNGLTKEHFVLSAVVTFGLLINPLIIGAVWLARNDIDRVLFGSVDQLDAKDGSYQYSARAKIWPTVVTVALLLVFGLWQVIMIIDGNPGHLSSLEQAWWIIILFPLIDLVVSSLLNRLTQLPVFQNAGFQKRKPRFLFFIRNIVRLVLITIVLLNLVDVLNIPLLNGLRGGERDLVEVMIDVGMIVLIGFIVWEIVLLWIEHKLPDEPDDDDAAGREEGAGAAATRTETLLPLLSTTLVIVLFIAVVLSVLSTLGVQIAPLLAGAGVVGIAVGFGSQKLVQDILSGVFFLVDDAFRKGEYVVLAGMGGTVEKLSLRSMQLRHHRGAVQTIPYGEIQTVKNHSRDWTTMKLELRLPYDVDIEKVRKIVKKIGQELLEDEEHGPHMLAPLKSQGVMRVEESALIFRLKFTVVPGEQWVIRRVAFTRVRDALSAAGIEFARREVKVRLPEELEGLQIKDLERKLLSKDEMDTESKEGSSSPAIIAAAAISAVVAQELEEKGADDVIDDR